MDQRVIKTLLGNAANITTGGGQKVPAGADLVACAIKDLADHIHPEVRLIANPLLDTIYHSTLAGDPESLPGLFPVFATLCGDRKPGEHFAEIDWEVACGN